MKKLDEYYKPVRHLPLPETREDWDNVWKTAKSLIDSTPKDKPADMRGVLDLLADKFGLGITPKMIRDFFYRDRDYMRFLQTFISSTEIKRIAQDVLRRMQNGETGFTSEKYRDIYKGQESKKEFDSCIDLLFDHLVSQICSAGKKQKSTNKKTTGAKTTGKKSTKRKSP
jgi:hypothetical protein